MTFSCAAARVRFELLLADALPRAERAAIKAHLSGCAACRDQAAALEPTLLFAAVRPEPVEAAEVERILAAVRTGVALKETEQKLVSRPRGARRRAGAAASAAALALLTLALPGGSVRRSVSELPAPIAEQVAPAGVGSTPVAQPASGGILPAEATIYDWNPGAGPEEPRVVWIVDRSLDI